MPGRAQTALAAMMTTMVVATLLPGLAGCTGDRSLAEAVAPRADVTMWPIQNRSGVDLEELPGLLWRGSDMLRLLVQMEVSEAPLAAWPFPEPGVLPAVVPAESVLRSHLGYDETRQVVQWQEAMMREERDRLRGLSDDAAWRTAIDTLYANGRRERVDFTALLSKSLTAGLAANGLQPREVPGTATDSDAAAVLVVTVTRWDASHVFETGKLRVAATAALIERATGAVRWSRSTGTIQLRVMDGASGSLGVLDLRPYYPQIAAELTQRLLAS